MCIRDRCYTVGDGDAGKAVPDLAIEVAWTPEDLDSLAIYAGLGVRDGDHVALWRRDTAEPGDLAAVLDATGRAGLWRVYPERDELRLTTGDPAYARPSGRRPRVQGVVVAVHRSFSARPVAARASSGRTAAPPTARPRSTNAASARGTPLTSVPPRVSGRGA